MAVALTAVLLLLCRVAQVPHNGIPFTAGALYVLCFRRRRWVSTRLAIVEWLAAMVAFASPVTIPTFGQVPGGILALAGLIVWLWAFYHATNRFLRADPWYGEP